METRGLRDHLEEQLRYLSLSEREQRMGEEIIGNIDDHGSLSCSLEQVVEGVNAWLAEVRPTAEANARNAQTAYRLGGGTLFQVTDAQRQLSRARRSLIQAQGQKYADLVQLYAATAADWREAAPTT